ncbi:MAG: SgcJ/EcaC family oxidoreductase [Thermoanaerobaculia bacterium]|nr:SgcJ/EcaC family oxidoreductase [Thermoanaerobaculia bacterium]
MRMIILLSTISLIFSIGCAPEPADDVAEPSGTTAPAPVQPQSDEDAVAAIGEVRSAWIESAEADDAAAVAKLYAEDAVFVSPMSGPVRGSDALEQHWSETFATAADTTVEPEKTEVSGDLAYDYGTFSQTITPPDGDAQDIEGHYVVVMKRTGGEWKIVRHLSAPLEPAASGTNG